MKRSYLGRIFALGLIASFIHGCPPPKDTQRQWIEGTVVEERYVEASNLVRSPEKRIDGLVSQAFSNETVKLGRSKYCFKLVTDDQEVYVVSVIDNDDGGKEAVDLLINKGSRVKFSRYYDSTISGPDALYGLDGPHSTQFVHGRRVGNRRPVDIRVLK